MTEETRRPPELLHYRPWQGALRQESAPEESPSSLLRPSSWLRAAQVSWPIGRTALWQILRRKLFWGLYGLALLVFLLFFFSQYVFAVAAAQFGSTEIRIPGIGRFPAGEIVKKLRTDLHFDGSPETYRNFIWSEGYMVMIILALAGAVLIGNDLRFGSLPFYLSKPLSRWHYLLGKGLAVAFFVNLLTTIPALVLFVEFGVLEPGGARDALPVPYLGLACLAGVLATWALRRSFWLGWLWLALAVLMMEIVVRFTGAYFFEQAYLALGIVGYGAVLTVSLTLLLLAMASWLQKTVPLILAWATLFVFGWLLSVALVDRLHFDAHWRLLDLWHCAYLVGNHFLRIDPSTILPSPQPAWYEAAGVLTGVSLSCLTYLVLRIKAVEIVR